MIGLVLQGGGGKGGYHIGVWQALRELKVEIGAVTGTSVGALNGAFIAQNDFERAYNIWYNMDPRLVIKDDPEIYRELVKRDYDVKNRKMYFEYFKKIIRQNGLNIEPLIDLIAQEVDEEKVRASKIEFGLVTVSLTDWKAVELFVEDIEEGRLTDYLLASAYLPAFKSQMIHGKRYIDGGFYDSMPINLMGRKGYSEVVAVELGGPGMVRSVKDKKMKVRYITPSGDTGSMLEFDRERSRANLKMGYLDAMKSYGHYEGRSYYLTDIPSEEDFCQHLNDLSDEQILTMAKIVGQRTGYPHRLLHEVIIPEICSMVGLTIESNYRDIMVAAIEFIASSLEIDRLLAYTYEELLSLVEVRTKNMPKKTFNFELIPDLLLRQSIIRNSFKADLLIKWLGITSGIYEG